MESTETNSEGGFDLVNQDCLSIELKSYEATDKVFSLIEKYVTKKRLEIRPVFSFQF
jgi:hypothetical protein